MIRRNVPMIGLVAGAALWMATVANWPLWRELHRIGWFDQPHPIVVTSALCLLIASLLMALLSLLA